MNKLIGIRKIANIKFVSEFTEDKKVLIKKYISEITLQLIKSPQYIVEYSTFPNMNNILDSNGNTINSLYISEMKI